MFNRLFGRYFVWWAFYLMGLLVINETDELFVSHSCMTTMKTFQNKKS